MSLRCLALSRALRQVAPWVDFIDAHELKDSPKYKRLIRESNLIRAEYGMQPLPDGTYDIDELWAYYTQIRDARAQGWPIADDSSDAGLPVIKADPSKRQWKLIWRLWAKYFALGDRRLYDGIYEGAQVSQTNRDSD